MDLHPGQQQELRHAANLLRDRSAGWADRDAALQRVAELLREASIGAGSHGMVRLLPGISAQLSDLRSQIVRSACDVLAALSEVVTDADAGALEKPVREKVAPSLLVLAASANPVLAGFARDTLPQLAGVVCSASLFRLYVGELHTSKHVAGRVLACRCVLDALRSWPVATLEGAAPLLEVVLPSAAAEASQEVRSVARECLGEYKRVLPASAERAVAKLNATTRRHLDRGLESIEPAGGPPADVGLRAGRRGPSGVSGGLADRSKSISPTKASSRVRRPNSRSQGVLPTRSQPRGGYAQPDSKSDQGSGYAQGQAGGGAGRAALAGERSGGSAASDPLAAAQLSAGPSRASAVLDPEWAHELQEADIEEWGEWKVVPQASPQDGTPVAEALRAASLHATKESAAQWQGDELAAGATKASSGGRQSSAAAARRVEAAARRAAEAESVRLAPARAQEELVRQRLALAALSEQEDAELTLQRGDPVRAEAARARARIDATVAVRQARRASDGRGCDGLDGGREGVQRVLQEMEGELSLDSLESLEQTVLAELNRDEEDLRESRRWWPGQTRRSDSGGARAEPALADEGESEERAANVMQAGLRARQARLQLRAQRDEERAATVMQANLRARQARLESRAQRNALEEEQRRVAADEAERAAAAEAEEDDEAAGVEGSEDGKASDGARAPEETEAPRPRRKLSPLRRAAPRDARDDAAIPTRAPPPCWPQQRAEDMRGEQGQQLYDQWQQWQHWQQQMQWQGQHARSMPAGGAPHSLLERQAAALSHVAMAQQAQQMARLQAGISAALEMQRHNAVSAYLLGAQGTVQAAAQHAAWANPYAAPPRGAAHVQARAAAAVGALLPAINALPPSLRGQTQAAYPLQRQAAAPHPHHVYLDQMDSRQQRQLRKLAPRGSGSY